MDDIPLVANYRPVSLTSVVCKEMENSIALYLRQMWGKMPGCTKGNTVSGQDIRVKVKSRYVRTLIMRWIMVTGLTLLLWIFESF